MFWLYQKLYEKLRRRGFPHECAKDAADFVSEKAYIDEDWQIESYLKTLVEKKHFGKRKVVANLISKGYASGKITQIIDQNYGDEYFREAKRNFLLETFQKEKPETQKEAEEMKKALYKQGYWYFYY